MQARSELRAERMLVDGNFIGNPEQLVSAPFDGSTVGMVAQGGWVEADAAISAAHQAYADARSSSPEERRSLLKRIAELVREREGELVEVLTDEVGKPIKWSQGEVMRLALTFDLAASLTDREPVICDLTYDPRGGDYSAEVRRYPIGVVLGIVPYNWPFNLAAHKLAPAIAVGNTVVLKPSNQAPLSTLMLCRLIHEAGCPPGWVNAVVVPSDIAERMALDDRVAMVSFTGSPKVGWSLRGKLPEKKVSLELGGDAWAIVHEDADLDWAAERIVWGKYGYAGQICISVQHVACHASVVDEFREKLIEKVRRCAYGDPRLPETVCGPLISSDAANKVMDWVEEAKRAGATVLAGGGRSGNVIEPTLLENVAANTRLGCEEVFGPVLTLQAYDGIEALTDRINSGPYGIHCGLFATEDSTIAYVTDEIHVGGIVINDVPTVRFDALPYGGVKKSGYGREGVRYAMEEMTELKSVVRRLK